LNGNIESPLYRAERSYIYKTSTFKLRPGVKFHDGTPFNAQAVAWKYARHKDPNNHCNCAFAIQFIDRVEAGPPFEGGRRQLRLL
jgi:ABC-type transport system substrate-binding protein